MELEIIVHPSLGDHLITSKIVELSISTPIDGSQSKKIVEIILDELL